MAAAEPPRDSSCMPSEKSSTTLVALSRACSKSSPARFKPAEIEVSPSDKITSIAASILPSSVDHVTRILAVSLKDTTEKRAARLVEPIENRSTTSLARAFTPSIALSELWV